ncbi:hypothetical protein EC973_008301 [Apophysomyces ossiformis]|uniref:U3 small nucleolar RNA-associated protein 22 n=1 Tax=Apophysomyces ossiformis TaxID=679940 RepID=A0A8H7EVC7_9FUNG|nr:hypothetical protein EC973_008301 [Apophysomyces ossiformis]
MWNLPLFDKVTRPSMAPALKRKLKHSGQQKQQNKIAKTEPDQLTKRSVNEESDEQSDYIGDDDEDLMEAARTGKYGSDYEENDDGWEEQSDEDADSEEDANAEDSQSKSDDKEMMGGELEGLKETTELYKSNMFKLEIDELLAEVNVNYEKHKALQKALHYLKETFDKIPDGKETLLNVLQTGMERKDKISIPFLRPHPPVDAQYKFKFQKPTAVHVVGSYALKSVTKTKGYFNVDVAVEMPSSIFQEKDHMNNRYFHKRSCYLAVLSKAIKDSNAGFNLEFSTFNGDIRKPVLLVKPSGDKSDLDFTKSRCIIRILPSIASDVFRVQRLAPGRNNVRPKEESDATALKPTPQYNASVLTDSTFTANLAFLYQHSKNTPAFKDAIVLARTWLFQRGLAREEQTGSGFSSFLFAMLMGYLLQGGGSGGGKKLSPSHSSYQLLRGTIDFIANHDFASQPVFIGRSENEEVGVNDGVPWTYRISYKPQFSAESFMANYDVAIVDPSGALNLAARVNLSTILQVQYEAKLAMKYFNDTADRFEPLFLKNVNDMKMRFDNVFRLSLPESRIKQYNGAIEADYPSYHTFFAKKIGEVMKRGLSNRAELISVQYTAPATWQISESAPSFDGNVTITVGLVLNSDNAARLVDQGPDAQQVQEAKEFREFWGKKAELRRFKDGSILESVVWETKGYENRTLIVRRIVSYLLQLHLDVSTENVQYWAGQLYPYINYAKTVPSSLFSHDLAIAGFQPVTTAYTEFAKLVRSVDDALPILIGNIYPASSSLRQASPLLPHPTDFDNITFYPTSARYIEAIDVIVQLERSSKWPEDLSAVQKVKHAFYLKMSEEIKARYGHTSVVVDDVWEKNELAIRGWVDVYYGGFVFRCHIHLDQEKELLEKIITSKTESKAKKELAQRALEKYERIFHYRQRHTFAIQALCARSTAFSPTMRLIKRWFGAHLLTNHLSEELIELICAYTFVESHPWAPAVNAFTGFARVLGLLATWDWQNTPLIVDIEGEMTASDRDTIMERFAHLRSQNPKITHGAFVVATTKDLDGLRWTYSKPCKVVASRIQALARASCTVLDEIIQSGEEKNIKRLFVTPMQDYSAVIQLNPERCTRYFQNLHPNQKYLSLTQESTSELGNKVYVQFDPVADFVKDIENTYGDLLLVFYDKYGGDKIALVWNPVKITPQLWKLRLGYNSIPVDMSKKGTLKPSNETGEILKLAAPNFAAILSEIERFGEGLVESIETA